MPSASSDENEVALPSPPSDGVTALRFAPSLGATDTLVASSWDATLRLYALGGPNAVGAPNALALTRQAESPLLDCDFVGGDAATVASGGLDGVVRLHTALDTRREAGSGSGVGLVGSQVSADATTTRVLGSHEGGGARCVRSCAAAGPACLVSGAWDASLKVWDVRAATPCVGTFEQPGKVLSLCTGTAAGAPPSGPPLLVAAFTDRQIALVDLRRPGEPLQRYESSLKCQTRCVAQNPAGDSFSLGSVEGRVAVEYVDPSDEAQARRYAFKCHRMPVGGVDTAFPVNAIAFHPRHGTFATGGGDGHVFVWDGAKKKRICSLKRYPTSVACMAFSPGGDTLAVASSYTYENGEQAHPPDAIFVRKVADVDVRPKAPKAAA